MKKYQIPIFIVCLIVILDQALKTWVKFHMYIGQDISLIGHWFKLQYIDNDGIAFGIEFGSGTGKLILSLFRVVAIGILGYVIYFYLKKNAETWFIIGLSLIMAGATGNMIDGIFYGTIYHYAPLFHGRVIDMLYFPLFTIHFPTWFPLMSGKDYLFFEYVFNIADSSVFCGVVWMLIHNKKGGSVLEPPILTN